MKQSRPYTHASFSFKVVGGLCWTPEKPDMFFPVEMKELREQGLINEFVQRDWQASPMAWLTLQDSLKRVLLDRCVKVLGVQL